MSEYPRWFKSKNSNQVIRFDSETEAIVVSNHTGSIGYILTYGDIQKIDKINYEEVTDKYKDKTEIPPLEMCGTPKCEHDIPYDSECKECQEKEINKKMFRYFQPKIEEDKKPFSVEEKGHNNGGSTDYYKFNKNWKECQDVIEDRKMNFAQGNIFKASFCFNQGRHDATTYERELNKIIYFAQRELERIKNVEA